MFLGIIHGVPKLRISIIPFSDDMPDFVLSYGIDVPIEGVGAFYLHLKGELIDSPDDFRIYDLDDVEIRFKVDKKLKKQLRGIKFE